MFFYAIIKKQQKKRKEKDIKKVKKYNNMPEKLKNYPVKITENSFYDFKIVDTGLYFIEIIVSCKNWRQNWKRFFNDDDLAVKIDDIEFPKLNGKNGLFNGEAAWNGNNLKGAKKTGIFVVQLKSGKHRINFIANQHPFLESIRIEKLENENLIKYISKSNNPVQDGNNRQWVSIALVNLPLKHLAIKAKAEKRGKDRDDIKLIIDGEIQQNLASEYFKNWYWCGSLDEGKEKTFEKELNLPKGLRYIELWADRMPTLNEVKIILEDDEDKQQITAKVVWKTADYNTLPDETKNFIDHVKKCYNEYKNKNQLGFIKYFWLLALSTLIVFAGSILFYQSAVSSKNKIIDSIRGESILVESNNDELEKFYKLVDDLDGDGDEEEIDFRFYYGDILERLTDMEFQGQTIKMRGAPHGFTKDITGDGLKEVIVELEVGVNGIWTEIYRLNDNGHLEIISTIPEYKSSGFLNRIGIKFVDYDDDGKLEIRVDYNYISDPCDGKADIYEFIKGKFIKTAEIIEFRESCEMFMAEVKG